MLYFAYEEWSDSDERLGRLRRDGSGERVGRRTSQSLTLDSTGLLGARVRIENVIDYPTPIWY